MSVDGEWRFTIDAGEYGVSQATAKFETKGDVLSGSFDSPMMGVVAVEEGKVDGDEVSFAVAGQARGVCRGKVDGDSITGTMEVDPIGEFEFSAVRV